MKLIAFLEAALICTILLFSLFTFPVSADYKYDYYDFDEMVAVLEDLETQSSSKTPDVYSLQIIGYSFLNNPIYAVKFSDDPATDQEEKPDVLIDAGIHSNEWISSESTIKYIEYLFDAYYDDLHPDHAEVVNLVNDFEIWLIPMINPDGRVRDDLNNGDPESFWTDTSYHVDDTIGWRMNVQEVDCPAKSGGTNQGIDLNRNFSYKFWELSNCLTTTYSGGTAFYAPEARVLKQFIHNHMISLVLHQHSNAQLIYSASGFTGMGDYLSGEAAAIYDVDIPDPMMTLWTPTAPAGAFLSSTYDSKLELYLKSTPQPFATTGSFLGSGVCDGSGYTGQYWSWLWTEIGNPQDCPLAPDNHSRRTIQPIMYEFGTEDTIYGHPDEGKIGQYEQGDSSNGFHPSSGDINDWIIEKSREINKYFIQQSRYPFSPRNYQDMSRKDVAPETDLAIVGAKISEAGTGLPGCFGFNNHGRDTLEPGNKRITWNVQNNGTANRSIDSEITICNFSDDPNCLSATAAILSRTDVTPEAIETFTYDYAFPDHGAAKIYRVTLTTGESNSYNNDLKRFVFSLTSATDSDGDGVTDGIDTCGDVANASLGGTCTGGFIGRACLHDAGCGSGGICSTDQEDADSDTLGDVCDNCPVRPNTAALGTCVKPVSGVLSTAGTACSDDGDCASGEICDLAQGDCNGNGCGDACECYADITGTSGKVDLTDLVVMKGEFSQPCPPSLCTADLNGDNKVDLQDLVLMKREFNRTGCPACP